MDRRLHDPLGSRASSCYSSSDHDYEMHHSTSDDEFDGEGTFISFTTTETKCEELFEEGLQHKLRGELDQAVPCFLKCLEGMQECQYFAKLPQTLHILAEVYQSLQCYDKAVEFAQAEKLFYEAVLIDSSRSQVSETGRTAPERKQRTKRKPFGKKPRDQSWRRGSNPAEYGDLMIKKADEYNHLAKLCAKQQKYDLALDYCGKAANIRKSVFGDNHPVTKETLDYLTVLYAEVGRAEYVSVIQTMHRTQSSETEDQRGDLFHVKMDQSSTSESDNGLNSNVQLPQTSAGMLSTDASASLTMDHPVDGRAAGHVCESESPAKEATLLREDVSFSTNATLKECEQRPSLDQGWSCITYPEAQQDVRSHQPSCYVDCQNHSPQDHMNSSQGHHQETEGIHINKSDLSDVSNDIHNSHSCTLSKQSSVETVNDAVLSSTHPLPNKEGYGEPNATKTATVITDVLSKAPGCVYVPVPEQGIEHARCLPLWVLLLGAFVEMAILAYVFFNRH